MIKKFLRDESGLELSEYAVAAALVALAVVAAFQLLGTDHPDPGDQLQIGAKRLCIVAPVCIQHAVSLARHICRVDERLHRLVHRLD